MPDLSSVHNKSFSNEKDFINDDVTADGVYIRCM